MTEITAITSPATIAIGRSDAMLKEVIAVFPVAFTAAFQVSVSPRLAEVATVVNAPARIVPMIRVTTTATIEMTPATTPIFPSCIAAFVPAIFSCACAFIAIMKCPVVSKYFILYLSTSYILLFSPYIYLILTIV